ncbi:MAG TPA: ComEC/Rec2 family competence protein [Pseudorhizobium sp.]|nr:ComEC/Rec2 family competence protein [Pseudorhizobium sp.]
MPQERAVYQSASSEDVVSSLALPGAGPADGIARSEADRRVFAGSRRFVPSLRPAFLRSERLAGRLHSAVRREADFGRGFLFAPVLVGIGAATWFSLPADPPFSFIFVSFALTCLLALIGRHRNGVTPMALLALMLAGAVLAQLETTRRATVILDSPVTTVVTGEVHRREAAGDGRWRYELDLLETADPVIRRPPEQVVLLARSRHPPFEAGEVLTGRARLSPPSGPALPGLNDFAFGAYYDGIGAVGFFYGAPKKVAGATGVAQGWAAGVERNIFALRGTIAERIRAVVPGDAGAFAAAIVTDERRAISKETTEALRISGLAHIVAISGLNMALAAGIFFVGLRTCLGLFTGFAQAWPVKKIAAFGALLMATAYYLISGFAVSAERAYLMMAVMLVAVLFDRAAISLRNVALSALVILAVSPSEIMGPSFQMSFAATAALVAGYSVWSERAARRQREPSALAKGRFAPVATVWSFLAGVFVTSLIGGLSTAIYSMDHFHRLAGYGLAANLAVMPIISFLVMPAGLVAMLLMPFGIDAPFLKLMGAGLEAVIAVAAHVASWGGDVGVGRQHPWFLGLASAGFVLLALLRTRLRLLGLPLMALAFLLSWQEQRRPLPDLLVSEDGSLVALHGSSVNGSVVATNRAKPPAFVFDQWQRALLLPDPLKPVMSPAGDAGLAGTDSASRAALTAPQLADVRRAMRNALDDAAATPARFHCRAKAWCVAMAEEGVAIAAVEDGRLTGIACDVAAIVIAPRTRLDRCRSGALLLAGTTLRKTGALEVHLNGTDDPGRWYAKAAIVGAERPWLSHRLYDWRSGAFDSTIPEPVQRLISGSGG